MPWMPCSIKGCDNRARGRGWCYAHYSRWQRHGDPVASVRIVGDDVARFWRYTSATFEGDACWEWVGHRNPKGYGRTRFQGRNVMAHRLAHELFIGPIPDGMVVMHICDNPPCVRFSHLRLGTHLANSADKIEKGRARLGPSRRGLLRVTHCPHGHEYTPENTRIYGGNKRDCRACRTLFGKRSRKEAC